MRERREPSHLFEPSTTIRTPGTGNNKSHWLDNDLLELNLNCGLAWCLTMSLSNPERLWMVVPSPQFTYMIFIYSQLQSKIRATFWVYVCNQSTSLAQISGNASLIDGPNFCSVRRKLWLSQTYFPWRKNNCLHPWEIGENADLSPPKYFRRRRIW